MVVFVGYLSCLCPFEKELKTCSKTADFMTEFYSMITTQQRARGVVLYEPLKCNRSFVSVVPLSQYVLYE